MSNVSYALTRYPHIRFLKHWELSRAVVYQLGECEAIISAICEMPIHPQHHERLLYVSLVKGAQATTAIEGNTLTNEEVERVAEGESLARYRQMLCIRRQAAFCLTPSTKGTPSMTSAIS